MLSPLAELTGGNILRVNPLNLSKDFADILSDNVVATNVELSVKLHKGLTFRNENTSDLSQDGSSMKKQIGNASESQEITIEYCTKPSKELKKMNDIDFTKVNFFPFQAQIKYTTLDGMKCIRLITKPQKITFEKEEAKKEMDHNIISINAIQQSAKIAQRGDFRSAQANMYNWRNML